MALVVKSWKVASHPAPGEPNVVIVARDSQAQGSGLDCFQSAIHAPLRFR